MNKNKGSQKIRLQKVQRTGQKTVQDHIVREEPLEIRLRYGPANHRREHPLAILMRTPGHDHELTLGLLFTEQIITSARQVLNMRYEQANENFPLHGQRLLVNLPNAKLPEEISNEHRFITANSACGICGATVIDQLDRQPAFLPLPATPHISKTLLFSLPDKLQHAQKLFSCTGGLHAAALFSPSGKLIQRFEDVGRHNALDKLIGYALRQNMLPLNHHILLLSGRIGFELVQKAAMAGIAFITAIGAPSSAALQTAGTHGITLVGFLKKNSFNLYTHPERVH